MNIVSYIHPSRTYLPCSGAGRHINNVLLGMSSIDEVSLELLFSNQWIGEDKKLPINCPLRDIPFSTFPMQENRTERLWKAVNFPKMDKYISKGTDWVFAPMETYVPLRNFPFAFTIFDIQAFEDDLPWSNSWQHRLFKYKWSGWVTKAIKESRVVFTISEFTKSRLVKLLAVDPIKIVNVGCGVEPAFFNASNLVLNADDRPTPNPYIFMIGGLRQKKGGDFFLNIAKYLEKEKSDIQIVIAGPSEESYVKRAKELKNIKLLGIVPDEDLPKLLRGALCLLFLSLYEGFGIPSLEAMAAGVPSVVSNKASLPEVVGDAGIIVNPENTGEIVSLLKELLVSASFRNEFIEKGKVHAEKYKWERTAAKVVSTLKERW